MSQFYQDSIFWIDVDKIRPNPFQPRRDFDPLQLQALADSIRQYGVLQALVVTRNEVPKDDGGLAVEYELIAGERRLRAAKLAGVREVPCLIKAGEENSLMKLELAIIENVQREDLNAVDRARAFDRLVKEFGFKHTTIAEKIGKSREYVSNTLRILALPASMLDALSAGQITEGHTRPLMMLSDRPVEQETLFREIITRKLNVRDAELIARKIAVDRVRKKDFSGDPEVTEIEKKMADTLGTRVHIERKEVGGKLTIDFFSKDDLRAIWNLINSNHGAGDARGEAVVMPPRMPVEGGQKNTSGVEEISSVAAEMTTPLDAEQQIGLEQQVPLDDRTPEQKKQDDNEDIYSVSNFSI
jgi:ParB family chromosome partitioning protein